MSSVQRGPWLQTRTGLAFYPLDPRSEDVCLEDVAHSLAYSNRFGGHAGTYSVAEHCVRASWCVAPKALDVELAVERFFRLAALVHDAHEPFVIDLPRPLKLALRNYGKESAYDAIEDAVQRVVVARFGVPLSLVRCAAVKRADEVMLATEARDLMAPPPMPWTYAVDNPVPLPGRIVPWQPEEAKARWLARFAELGGIP